MTVYSISQEGGSFEFVNCGACGVRFAAREKFFDEHRETKATFYCPNGHPRAFKESTADALVDEVTR
jgi:hypothetical protein